VVLPVSGINPVVIAALGGDDFSDCVPRAQQKKHYTFKFLN
jgi:hypothetical protein